MLFLRHCCPSFEMFLSDFEGSRNCLRDMLNVWIVPANGEIRLSPSRMIESRSRRESLMLSGLVEEDGAGRWR